MRKYDFREIQYTDIINFKHSEIQLLITRHNWQNLCNYKKIDAIYQFVKDEILFGYNDRSNLCIS